MFSKIKSYYKNILPQLTEEEWLAIESKLVFHQYKKGETISKLGEVCNYVSFINKGFVRYYIEKDNKQIPLAFFIEGQYISSYESYLTRNPATEIADALTDTELICLHYDDVQLLYKEYPIYQNFGRKVAESLFITLSQRIYSLQVLTPEERYIRLIDKNSQLPQLIPQYMLASYLAITPEHLSRIRKKMTTIKK